MYMKRAILIATGTVGGLGAVLAITPPTFTSTTSSPMALPGAGNAAVSNAATAAATKSAAPAKSASGAATKAAAPTKTATTNNAQSQTPAAQTPTPAAAPATKAVSGTFTGDVVNVRYGNVQVKITVENGKITDAQAVQAPSGRNDRWTQMAVPILRQQTLQAQSANINGASGASFTSYGWYTSLASALAKAGM
jgi:uncharacterized protein with FMN-binding domain